MPPLSLGEPLLATIGIPWKKSCLERSYTDEGFCGDAGKARRLPSTTTLRRFVRTRVGRDNVLVHILSIHW